MGDSSLAKVTDSGSLSLSLSQLESTTIGDDEDIRLKRIFEDVRTELETKAKD